MLPIKCRHIKGTMGKHAINDKICFDGIPLGIIVQKQLAKRYIYRYRSGNGYYGAKVGKKYQEKFEYKVPSSIRNSQGEPARNAMRAAEYNWKFILSTEEKKEWNEKANKKGGTTGHAEYVGYYIKNNL